MNNRMEHYIAQVLHCVKCKKLHRQISEELQAHICDLSEEYQEQGLSMEDAQKRAIAAMGDASMVGELLNQQHKPQMGWGILLLTVVASLFGILVMCIPQYPGRQGGSLEKTLFFIALGIPLLLGIYFFDYSKLRKYPFYFYLGGMILTLACGLFGDHVTGVRSYLSIGRINLYVPGVLVVLYMIAFCGFIDRFRGQGIWGICKLFLLGGLSLLGYFIFPCLSYAAFLGISYAVVLLKATYCNQFSKNGKQIFSWLLILFLLLVIFSILFLFAVSPERIYRLFLFLDNGASDALNSGWIYMISHKILQASQWIGQSIPIPEGDVGWIMPDLTEDFALLNIISNYGWAYGVIVIIVALFLILRMFTMSFRVKYSFGRNLSLGCCILLCMQFVCNILMNIGWFPIIRVTLPFISSGGSLYLINVFLVGMILSVWRQNRILSCDSDNSSYTTARKRITFENKKLVIDFGNED